MSHPTPDHSAAADVSAVPGPDLPTISIKHRRLWDSLMEFVAGENGGISHTPREYSNPEACGSGIDMLANAVLRLAQQP